MIGFIKTFFSFLVFQPLYNALIILYVIIPDIGAAIILLTVIIRFLLVPISKKSIASQKRMQDIQPELKKIQKKYKHDRALQGKKVMEFYKEKKVNPTSGCLPMIIQLVFLIALYRVFIVGLGPDAPTELLYSFVKNPGQLNPIAFGFFDLSVPSIPLAVVAAALQFYQAKMMMRKQEKEKEKRKDKKDGKNKDKGETEPDFSTMIQQQLVYMGPVITLIIGVQFAAGLILYWAITTIFMIVQQHFVLSEDDKKEEKLNKRLAPSGNK
ncbi:MAG: YidC/Oxa1 family membrane protein insertase [Patescibacteria group bacterium]|nr:YidC/Oxa1 family membrane protein insertase [Patescibacteria group bacterium]